VRESLFAPRSLTLACLAAIVFVYDYHPLSTTLYGEHMVPKPPQLDRRTGRLQAVSMSISERTLWSYATQLTNVLRCIHGHGLAARCIEPSKVLRTGKNRVRLNGCSVFDVIAYDPRASASTLAAQQGEDLLNLGKLLVSLACNSMAAVQNLPKSLEQVTRAYSAELKNLILWLLGKPAPSKTADELGRLLGSHVADEVDSALNYADLLESGLSKELENARLVRLLCKFGFINERPECVSFCPSLFTLFLPLAHPLCSSASDSTTTRAGPRRAIATSSSCSATTSSTPSTTPAGPSWISRTSSPTSTSWMRAARRR